ncbi:MAG TPA: hypothetical protein VFX61_22585 [Micromonosporaceae bacterium]|nr:hypothetical protein [Micromonosporaceae bacterium]
MQERCAVDDPPPPERVVSPESLTRVLLTAASRALKRADCADLGNAVVLSRFRGTPESVRRAAATRAAVRAAIPAEQTGEIDVERIARWMVGHYPSRWYPAIVIGSPHGGAVHLATALGVPWLPAGFEVAVQWPNGAVDDPAAALAYGGDVVAPLLAANPGVGVRQVHDPVGRGLLAGSTVTLVVRWRRLPDAYRRFLDARLAPGAPVILLRDARTWPVLDPGAKHSFQVGGPASGLEPADYLPHSQPIRQVLRCVGGDQERWAPPAARCPQAHAEQGVEPGFEIGLREWSRGAGSSLHRVLFPESEALSSAAADIYRQWLQVEGKAANRCVVECGRLIDPWQVLRAGLVPYWCEKATDRSVAGAEWWLAGSVPFDSVDVLPEPPGLQSPRLARLPQWLAVAAFGRRRGAVDRTAARGYPVTPVSTRHATEVLRSHPDDLPVPRPLLPGVALAALRAGGPVQGLLVC